MINVENLCIGFQFNHVLKGLTLSVTESDIMVIVGRSGVGKSVLLKCLSGLLKPYEGRIFIDDEDIMVCSKKDLLRIRKKIGMVFQEGALFDSMNVYENVAFPLIYHKLASKAEIDKKVNKYLEIVEMRENRDSLPSELSGGMKRKVALARAMILEPKYLFYDEPTSGLDPTSSSIVESMILKLQKEMNITSLVVTHDIDLARFVGLNIALLEDGKIVSLERKNKAFTENSLIFNHFISKRKRNHKKNEN